VFFDLFDHWRIKEANWKSSHEVFISLLFWSFCWRLGAVISSLLLLNYGFVTFIWILKLLELVMFGILEWLYVGRNLIADKSILNKLLLWVSIEIEIEDILFVWCVLWWILNLIFWFIKICKGFLSKWMQTVFHQFQWFMHF